MKYLNQLLSEKAILFLLIPFLTGILFLMVGYGKGPSHLMVNSLNSPWADNFFKYLPNLGDGLIFAITILILLFIKIRWALYEFSAAIMTLVVVYLGKRVFFKGLPRPVTFFENSEALHLVAGVHLHEVNSFPSGHTITAFAVFMILTLSVKNHYLKFIFTSLAILIGYSRAYLSQHFLEDVFSGALIGTAIALLSFSLVDKLSIFKTSWIDLNLIEIFSKKHEQ
jgi:membrane-associated phospholipid phosphatase